MEMLCERSNAKHASGFQFAGGLTPMIELFKDASYSIFHIIFVCHVFPERSQTLSLHSNTCVAIKMEIIACLFLYNICMNIQYVKIKLWYFKFCVNLDFSTCGQLFY